MPEMSDWKPPAEFDDYRLLRPLGRGAMGLVFLAEDAMLARKVAIKFTQAPEPDAAARQRFLIEARAAARVQHPNVVSIYAVGELGDRPFLVTEFVAGRSLLDVEKPLPFERALAIGIDLARGLAAAHRQGVIHCDLKPANAMLGNDGSAKLLDFGLATLQRTEDGSQGGSRPGEGTSGSPGYLAPELWAGESGTRRSDVYSLGALLFELASGRTPFADVPVEQLQIVTRQREAPGLQVQAAQMGPPFAAIVARCLRRNPAERFASGDDLCEALEGLSRRGASGGPPPEGNPYRGLRAFEAGQRALFFGRGAEISIVLDRLRTDAFVLVAGDSGVGKSSLCRAGVLPAVAEGSLGGGRSWREISMVPGRQPLLALANALAPVLGLEPGAEIDALAAELRAQPETLPRLLSKRLGKDQGLLLFVDQLEELLTMGEPAEVRSADQALGALALGVPGVRLLATLRADFLTRFATLPALSEDLSRVLYFLRPLSLERTREVIAGPARVLGTRFESDAMIDELAQVTAQSEGALPLLQFALASLWEARDQEKNLITHAALERAGGVRGALSQHADAVVSGLLPPQRAAARRIFSRLVTLEGTRARRTEVELGAQEPVVREALDALVRGRLLVAQDAEQGSAYEVAHEVLVRGWGTLARWLQEDAALRTAREGLARSAAEWERLGRSRDGLLGAQQLAELAAFELQGLTDVERALLASSRNSLRRKRWLSIGAALLVPLIGFTVYAATRASTRSEVARRVEMHALAGTQALGRAAAATSAAAQLRSQAFTKFDSKDREGGETAWAQALVRAAEADSESGIASGELEVALAQDGTRDDVRALLANALFRWALLAEMEGADERRDELERRFRVYDQSGALERTFQKPATLSLKTQSVASAVLEGEGANGKDRALGDTPLAGLSIPIGTHLIVLSAPGRATVRFPFVATRGAELNLETVLPADGSVPAEFAYVPAGPFFFGSQADEEGRRGFFDTVPLHSMNGAAFLIARTEVTFADWLVYLRALPNTERTLRTPAVTAGSTGASLKLELDSNHPAKPAKLWLQTTGEPMTAMEDEPIRYPARTEHREQDWRRFPVTAVSADDAEAYAAWLRATGRNFSARLCTEQEWEHAARGADGRLYPNGRALSLTDANYDQTHTKDALGPDEVSAHPASRSPFGVDDLAGNAFEWTRSTLGDGDYVLRGGSYFHDRKTAQIANRNTSAHAIRDAAVGIRLCADLSAEPASSSRPATYLPH